MSAHIDLTTRRLLKLIAGGAVAAVAGCATRASTQPPEEGFEYRASAGVWPHRKPGKIEIAEFFWYACPFCNAFEPVLQEWFAKQSSDIVLTKVHPWPNKGWLPYSQLFWTLEAMGQEKQLSAQIYASIHQREMRLETREDVIAMVEGLGLDRQKFLAVFDSPQITASMDRANEMARFFKLDGVPALAVNGKWYTSPTMAGSRERTLQVLDFLIERERRAAS